MHAVQEVHAWVFGVEILLETNDDDIENGLFQEK